MYLKKDANKMFALDQAVWGKAKNCLKKKQLLRWDLDFHELEDPHNQQKPVEFQRKIVLFFSQTLNVWTIFTLLNFIGQWFQGPGRLSELIYHHFPTQFWMPFRPAPSGLPWSSNFQWNLELPKNP